jgi:mRNA interferase MazF
LEVRQGEIWWGDLPDEKSRPYVVLTRNEAIPVVHSVLVAPVSRRQRGIATEVGLDSHDGVAIESWANLDNIKTLRKAYLTRRLTTLAPGRWHEVCAAMRAAIDC